MGKDTGSNSKLVKVCIILAVIIIGALFLWNYVISPVIRWFGRNNSIVVTLLIVIIGILIALFIYKNREKLYTYEENIESYNPKLTWPPVNMKESAIIFDVWKRILTFKPNERYEQEYGYHLELYRWLFNKFPEATMNKKTGASKPDISIGSIAIEVKGPTGNRELDTLTTKTLKYRGHYSTILYVLFAPKYSEGHFAEIKNGMQRDWLNVGVITKKD